MPLVKTLLQTSLNAGRQLLSRSLAGLVEPGPAHGVMVWAAAGFIDTLLRCEMKSEVFDGNETEIQPRVQA